MLSKIAQLTLLLTLAGCLWTPSAMRIGGTPLDKADKAEVKRYDAKEKLLKSAQESAHKTAETLAAPQSERRDAVALDYARETAASLDQSLGAPTAESANKWRQQALDLLSENTAIRTKAEADRNAARADIAELSRDLAKKDAALEKAEAKALAYGKEADRLADYVRKAVWLLGGMVGLWVLSQALSIAARFNPAFSAASSLVGHVVSPVSQYALKRASDGLARVGAAVAEIEAKAPDVAAKVIQALDVHTDKDHQAAIKAGKTQTS